MLGDDPLAQPLEREPRRGRDEPVVALPERAEQLRVALVESGRQAALDAGEQRPPRRGAADQDERVVRDADERRREHGDERLVVVAVVQQAQVREQVDDLLLAEVAAPGRAVRRQTEPRAAPPRTTRHRCRPRTAGRSRPARRALVDELVHAPRDVLRLGAPPVRAAVRVRRLVGDEQLDRVAEHRIGELARRGERLELVAELGREEMVDRREHLGPRAVVPRQRQTLRRRRAPLAEDAHVGVAEAVDRLELVADEEDLPSPARRKQVDELALQRVRVLELVDHDRAEAQLLGSRTRSWSRAGRAPAAGGLEVERRLALLRRRVRRREESSSSCSSSRSRGASSSSAACSTALRASS